MATRISQSRKGKASRSSRRGREAALKGWRTRRANERKRSEAAKKGWRTRKRAKRRPAPPLKDFLFAFSYKKANKSRSYDLIIAARSEAHAERILEREIEEGNETYTWTQEVPWTSTTVADLGSSEANQSGIQER